MDWKVTGVILAAALVTGAAGSAAQDDDPTCSIARVAGEWGYGKAGTVFLPTGAVPFGTMGRLTVDAAGHVTGTQVASVGGSVSTGDLIGTLSVEADCSGTATLGVYSESGALLRTVVTAFVVDARATEMRLLVTSLLLPTGASLPSVITGDAMRLLPGHGDER